MLSLISLYSSCMSGSSESICKCSPITFSSYRTAGPVCRKTRFEFMHLTGGLVYQRQHHFKRKPVFLQQPGCKGIHMIGKITSEHRCQVQTFTLFGIGLIDILGEYGSNIFQCPGILRRIAFHETGICRKSTVRCLLNVCIG